MNRHVRVLGSRSLVIAAVVALSACGGSSGSSTDTTEVVQTTEVVNDAPIVCTTVVPILTCIVAPFQPSPKESVILKV